MVKRIRILATSDVHGNIFPHSYYTGRYQNSSFSRLSTLINFLRDENTLLLDNGDSLVGTPLSLYHYDRHPDDIAPSTIVMREMGYDYINIGNHDFQGGTEGLMMHLQNVKAPCLTSNFLFHDVPYGPTFAIREICGKKIALIGAVTSSVARLESKAHLTGASFKDAFETVKKNVELVRKLENPDYVVVLYHGGFERNPATNEPLANVGFENQGYKMLTQIPGIDVLIAGHQHLSMCGKLGSAVYAETAANGEEMVCVEIFPDTNEITCRLLKADTKADEALTKFVQAEEDECQAMMNEVLGTTKMDLKITDTFDARLHKAQAITLINQAMMAASGTDIASYALNADALGFSKEITMREVLSASPYPNLLVVLKVSGATLKKYLEKNAEYWLVTAESTIGVNPYYEKPVPKSAPYDIVDGLEYTINADNLPGNRITSLTYHGEPVADEKSYEITFTNYRASGAGEFGMLREGEVVRVVRRSLSDIIASYIKKQGTVSFEPVYNVHVEH